MFCGDFVLFLFACFTVINVSLTLLITLLLSAIVWQLTSIKHRKNIQMRNESSTRLKPRLSQMKHINETDNIVIFPCSRNLSTMVFKKKTHLKVLNGLGR